MNINTRFQFSWLRVGFDEPLDLKSWRNWFVNLMTVFAAFALPLAMLATFPIFIAEKHYGLIAFDLIIWLLVIVRLFIKGASFKVSASFCLAILYTMAITFFVALGPHHARSGWLVMCAVMASLMFGARAGAVFTAANAGVLMILYWLMGPENQAWAAEYTAPLSKWVMFVVNISLITLASSLPVGFLLNRLGRSLNSEQDALRKLLVESEKLQTAYTALKEEFEERKQAEEALRESEERYRLHFENASEVIYSLDRELKVVSVSPSVERVLGYRPEELTGKSFQDLNILVPDYTEAAYKDAMKVLAGETITSSVYEFIARDGTRKIGEISGAPMIREGKVVGLVSIARDISEQRRLQTRLQEAKKMEAIGNLAAGIAHQFNNALSSITGHCGLIKMDYPEDEKIVEHTKAMKQSAHRMAHLTSQLLAYARGGKYKSEPISLRAFVTSSLPLIQYELDPAVRVETDLPSDIMDVKVDPTQMQMVLSAILANSSEAMEGPGRIKISTRNMELDEGFVKNHPGLKPGPHVCLSVEDEGRGMDEETREKIFEPFFTTGFIGRGLGMAAVYGIVTNHDGWVSVDSEPNKGTIVRIYLPAIDSEEAAKKGASGKPEIESLKSEGTILIIEDEEDVMKIARQALERLGYNVVEAGTGKEAIDIAKTHDGKIDLALLDIKLPDIRGDKLYPLIMESRPDLKVVVFSGYTIDGLAQDILDAGAEGFIQKPFSISTLADKLKELLEGK